MRKQEIRGGEPHIWHRTPDFGDTNWPDVISISRRDNYAGAIDIENFRNAVYRGAAELTGQVHGLNYLKNCRLARGWKNPVEWN